MDSVIPLLSYVAELGRLAKETRCRVDGIGTDLIPTLFASHDGQLIGTATAIGDPEGDPVAAFQQVADATALMRTGWAADGICLLTEAFVGVNAAQDEADLASAFAEGNQDVHECLFLIGATASEIAVCALPYQYEVGRTIAWNEPLGEVPLPEATGPYLALFREVFTVEPVPFPPDRAGAIALIGDLLGAVGFVVETFADADVKIVADQ